MIDSGIVQAGLLKPGIVGVGLVSPYSRYFRTNDDLSYISIPEVTLSGDFEIEFQYAGTDVDVHFMGDSAFTSSRIFSFGGGWFIDNTAVNLGSNSAILDGRLHTLRVVRSGSTITGYVDGVQTGSGTSSTAFTFAQIGAWGGANNADGILANVRMYDNGTLVRNYPINDNSNIIANSAASLGAELWSNPTVPSPFVDNGDGTYSIDGTQAGPVSITSENLPTSGDTYLSSFEIVSASAGAANIRIGNVNGSAYSSAGTYTDVVTAAASNSIGVQVSGNFIGTIRPISVKQAPGYGSVVNGNASDWELFNQQADGDYLGQELAISSVSPVLGDTSDPEFFPVASIVGGNEYRIAATVLTFSGSADCGWTTTATGGVSNGIPATPPFRYTAPSIGDVVGGDFTSTSGPDARLFGRASAVCSFNNLTVKRLLRVA